MVLRPPRFTRTYTRFPYAALFRSAWPRRRRGAADHRRCTSRAGRRLGGDLDHPRLAAGRGRRAAHGPAVRPGPGVRRRADALMEADHQVHARRRDAQARGEGRTAVAGADARRARGRGDGRRGPRGARAGVRARGKRLGPARMTTTFDPAAEPYEDSRRLTGCNFYFSGPGARSEEHTSELQSLMRISYA